MDRQHAAAWLQALPVRLVRPAALQQDSRLQVRGEIEASALCTLSKMGLIYLKGDRVPKLFLV
jgi:hypothetical protein